MATIMNKEDKIFITDLQEEKEREEKCVKAFTNKNSCLSFTKYIVKKADETSSVRYIC